MAEIWQVKVEISKKLWKPKKNIFLIFQNRTSENQVLLCDVYGYCLINLTYQWIWPISLNWPDLYDWDKDVELFSGIGWKSNSIIDLFIVKEIECYILIIDKFKATLSEISTDVTHVTRKSRKYVEKILQNQVTRTYQEKKQSLQLLSSGGLDIADNSAVHYPCVST